MWLLCLLFLPFSNVFSKAVPVGTATPMERQRVVELFIFVSCTHVVLCVYETHKAYFSDPDIKGNHSVPPGLLPTTGRPRSPKVPLGLLTQAWSRGSTRD